MASTELTPLWLQHARAFERMMIHELPGHATHPLIAAFLQFTQLAQTPAAQSDETPWCSAFVCACMELAGYQSTRHALARSWDNWGVQLAQPKTGCVIVFKDTNHVAFCDASNTTATHIMTIGGNQQNRVCSLMYPVERVVSYRWIK